MYFWRGIMGFTDEVRGFLSDRLSGLLNESTNENRTALKDALKDLTAAVQSLEEIVDSLSVPNVDTLVEAWSEAIGEMVPPPPVQPSPIPDLYQQFISIIMAESQGELLQRLLDATANYADGIAVFVVRAEQATGWLAQGLEGIGAETGRFREYHIPLQEETLFTIACQQQEAVFSNEPPRGKDADLIEAFAGHRPSAFALIPIMIRGKVAGLIYVERHEEAWKDDDLDRLQMLIWTAGMALETMPTRLNWIRGHRTKSLPLRREISRRTEMPTRDLEEAAAEADSTAEASVAEPEVESAETEPTPAEAPVAEEEIEAELEELAALPEEERKKHEDARRFSRLLVSEIKLYNEQQVLLGRQAGDIFERLKDDILRSWQVYLERVDESVMRQRNYFYEDLVRILADGDPAKLGIDHWPPEDTTDE